MMGIGFPELMIILVIIMIIFGAGKLPEIGNAFGRSIKNFKTSMKEASEEDSKEETPSVEGDSASPVEVAGNSASPSEEEVTARLSGSQSSSASTPSQKASAPSAGTSTPAGQTQQAKAPQGKPKPKERVKSEEEKMIEDAIKELKDKRIGTIRTPHDGLVQQGDVFTESVKRNPFGSKRGKGVRRDVM